MKTALITGASRGIGAAIARRLSDDGFRVILNCRQSRDACVALARELGAYTIFADISREDEVAKMAEEAEALGGVDVLVNNAGIAMQKMLCDTAPTDWDGIFAADMRGAYLVTRALMGHMVHNKYGRIINISSIWGEEGASCEVAYSAAKAALIGFTKSLAKELAPPDFPASTAIGALAHYISNKAVTDFQPMNVNFGIFDQSEITAKRKKDRRAQISEMARKKIGRIAQEIFSEGE